MKMKSSADVEHQFAQKPMRTVKELLLWCTDLFQCERNVIVTRQVILH